MFEAERVAAAAWTVGGAEAERNARTRQASAACLLSLLKFVVFFASSQAGRIVPKSGNATYVALNVVNDFLAIQ